MTEKKQIIFILSLATFLGILRSFFMDDPEFTLIKQERIIEQVIATGAAAQNLLNALHARGYQAIWVTGAPCYDEYVKGSLGLAPKDALVGFIHIGTTKGGTTIKKRPDPAEFLQTW